MLSDTSHRTTTSAIATIAGSQSISAIAADDSTQIIIQAYRGHSIEDNQNDAMYVFFSVSLS